MCAAPSDLLAGPERFAVARRRLEPVDTSGQLLEHVVDRGWSSGDGVYTGKQFLLSGCGGEGGQLLVKINVVAATGEQRRASPMQQLKKKNGANMSGWRLQSQLLIGSAPSRDLSVGTTFILQQDSRTPPPTPQHLPVSHPRMDPPCKTQAARRNGDIRTRSIVLETVVVSSSG